MPSSQDIALTASAGDQLTIKYMSEGDTMSDYSSSALQSSDFPPQDTEVLVNTALLARIESIEAENEEWLSGMYIHLCIKQ